MVSEKKVRVLIAASGSGGHLFPALFIARAFQRKCQNLKLGFIGSGRPLEEKILGGGDFELYTLPVVGVKHRGLIGMLQSCILTPVAFIKALTLFKNFKPDLVIGVGGYVAFVPVVLGKIMGIPTWIHEAELKPGMANKVLKNFASKVSVAFREAELSKLKNAVFTGHPVRENLREVTPGLALGQVPRRILILGGSQGARALDQTLPQVFSEFETDSIEVWHQCRKEGVEEVMKAYKDAGVNAKVEAFIDDMAEAYSWADVLIARSGAGSTMEASVVNRPTIFVPYPHAQGDHQTANALTLVKMGKALLVHEGEDFKDRLSAAIKQVLDPNTYFAIKLAKYDGRALDAADRIVEGALALIPQK